MVSPGAAAAKTSSISPKGVAANRKPVSPKPNARSGPGAAAANTKKLGGLGTFAGAKAALGTQQASYTGAAAETAIEEPEGN